MGRAQACFTTVVLCLTLLQPTVSTAQDTSILAFFDCEGNSPFVEDRLEFSALASKVLTKNGHGLRNELKRKASHRRSMYQTRESLSGTISYKLSMGAKTIVAQYHDGNTGTLFKLFVADIRDSHLGNGVAKDGIFDVFARIDDTAGKEVLYPFITIHGNGSFDFALAADNGLISLSINGKTVIQKTKDSPGVYLKFGDYLQAQDPETGKQESHGQIANFYERFGITQDKIVFENVKYCKENGISKDTVAEVVKKALSVHTQYSGL